MQGIKGTIKVVRNGDEVEVTKADLSAAELREYNAAAKRAAREREAAEKNAESERSRIAKEFGLDPKADADEIEWRLSEALKERQYENEADRQKANLAGLSPDDRAALDARIAEFKAIDALLPTLTPDRAVLLAQEFDAKYPPSEERNLRLYHWKQFGVYADSTGRQRAALDRLTKFWVDHRFDSTFEFNWTLADRLMERVPTPTELNPWYKPLDVRLAEIRGVDIGSLFPRPRTGMKYVWTGSHYEEQNIEPADPVKRDASGNEAPAKTDAQIDGEKHEAVIASEVRTITTEDSVSRFQRELAERLKNVPGMPSSWAQ